MMQCGLTPGPAEGVADGKDELMKAVRAQFKKGADLIKIASTGGVLDLSKDGSGAQFTVDEIKAVVETAKDYGMKVACHAHGAEGNKTRHPWWRYFNRARHFYE